MRPRRVARRAEEFSFLLRMQERKRPGTMGKVGMRKDYWDFMDAARERLSERHPEKSKREILSMARKETLSFTIIFDLLYNCI